MNKILRYSFVALLAMVFGNVMATTVNVVIKNYATAQNWANNTKYTSIELDENITASVTGGGNTGKYYTAGDEWRLYQTETPKLTFTAKSGYVLNSITVTYAVKNTGVLLNGTDQVASGTAVSVNGSSHEFSVGNTGTATNGQVKVTAISVTYSADGDARVNANLSFSETSVKARLGKAFTAPTLTNENGAPVVYSSSETTVAEVNAETGAVTLKAAGTTTITAAVPESNTSYKGSASYTLTVEELATVNTFPFSETFANTFGKFLVEDVSLADGLSYVWSKNSGYAKASAYAGGTDYAAESWLISPLFDLTNTNEPSFVFEHATNYFKDLAAAKQEATVWVRIGEAGEWNQLVVAYPKELGWTFVSSGSVDLSEFIGKTIQIGFKYTSDAKAGTWEIKNFKVIDGQSAELAFSKEKASVILGAESPEYPTLTNPHNVTVTYSSSDTNVAEIDATTGAITPKADGKTTIKASFAGNGEYIAGEASYELTVIDESAKGRKGNPYTIAEVKALEESAYPSDKVWVIGYIAGCAANGGVISAGDPVNSNILLTATAEFSDADVLLPVQLSGSTTKTAVNLVDNPTNKGKEIKVYGKIQKYFSVAGVKEVTSHEFTGNSVEINVISGIANITAAKAENGVRYNLAGQKVNAGYKGVVIMNGKKFMQK
jgi:hypothetical protein